ncbi:dTMP kinase [Arthrobacter roseus]|uniref:dTMP kinase n=1 Tax=Arthrobacter roseus TaxID=136274 RepID=UPI001962568E|nr:dTMP kinase [Arthrobacter roseus]
MSFSQVSPGQDDDGAYAYSGVFVAFEGGDGAGKSTQAALLGARLEADGRHVLQTREPGGTPVGEQLRSLVLEHGNGDIDARTEALIFAAARAAHVEQVILPALQEGKIVISDRYIDSSAAYQGAGRDLGVETVLELNAWATQGLQPDLTVLLDVEPDQGRTRRTANQTAEDRLEAEPDDFHTRIRETFLALAEEDPTGYLVLNAQQDADSLATKVWQRLQPILDEIEQGNHH